ncbi:dinuclear metal center YbgI/SA1388 family protein [Streptosporangium becharense]|uniref:GTP cyclohydrolase 1 type 2 homolog n=1 Tax=Streptosporangium becharense TaxID=1816182 RepID=A0A7W9IKB2_9ACTN|nr:Nif3-like dinuclear metal center hexameric protein [Streptosporangium becharense]MBB2911864.1 dinuclear metal center YbgI/SA1388 family protein [Streptosporangium becharense]MBB5822318.1 dinuclear metal center YbgI/SA1388 family protein [Streptosporangium becharense]
MPTLADIVRELESRYDPRWAESWDAVGLVCGDPSAEIRKILFAVDPVAAVVDEALDWGADLIVTHHPLYLRGTTSVAATTFKGRVVHMLIKNDVALFTAHTNADVADPGVSDALARAVGLTGPLVPLQPAADAPRRGLGRIGSLPAPVPLAEFARRAASGLPATAGGLRVAGDPDRPVHRVAVSGGSGDSLLGAARAAGVDVFLTADLRHHPASEFMEGGGPALVDAAHWATEWPWLADAARLLASALAAGGITVETRVSETVTDAWNTTAKCEDFT